MVQALDWLDAGVLLRHFGRGLIQARSRFAQFVHDGYNRASIWSEFQPQIYLGDARFVAQMQSQMTDESTPLDEVPKVQRQRSPQPLPEIEAAQGDRRAAMAAAYAFGAYTMKTIVAYFGVHYSTVSRAVRAAEDAKALNSTR